MRTDESRQKLHCLVYLHPPQKGGVGPPFLGGCFTPLPAGGQNDPFWGCFPGGVKCSQESVSGWVVSPGGMSVYMVVPGCRPDNRVAHVVRRTCCTGVTVPSGRAHRMDVWHQGWVIRGTWLCRMSGSPMSWLSGAQDVGMSGGTPGGRTGVPGGGHMPDSQATTCHSGRRAPGHSTTTVG